MSVRKVPQLDQAATSACAENKEGPKPGERVQLSRMEHCFALCVGWCLVPRDVLPPFRNIVAHSEWHVQRTLPFGPCFFRTKLFVGHGGGGLLCFYAPGIHCATDSSFLYVYVKPSPLAQTH